MCVPSKKRENQYANMGEEKDILLLKNIFRIGRCQIKNFELIDQFGRKYERNQRVVAYEIWLVMWRNIPRVDGGWLVLIATIN